MPGILWNAWFLSLLVPYTLFWVFVVLNYLPVEGLRLGFLIVNTWHISVIVNLGSSSFLVHIGAIELVFLTSSLALFYLAFRDAYGTLIFHFSTMLAVEIGTYFYLYQYFDTWVTSVQVFWHLPLVTNRELLYGSIGSLAILTPIWMRQRKRNRMKQVSAARVPTTITS